MCLEFCPIGYFPTLTYEENYCCSKCSDRCFDGCSGSFPYAKENGCNKCMYGFVTGNDTYREYKCLQPFEQHKVCRLNNLTNYYLESIELSIPGKSKFECRQCHNACTACESFGDDVDKNGCICSDALIKSINGHRICSFSQMFDGHANSSNLALIFMTTTLVLIVCIGTVCCFKKYRFQCTKRNSSDKKIEQEYENLYLHSEHRRPSFLDFPIYQSLSEPMCEAPIYKHSPILITNEPTRIIENIKEYIPFTVPPPSINQPTINVFMEYIPFGSPQPTINLNNKISFISLEELTIKNQINNGEFGLVYTGEWNGKTVAIKKLKDSSSDTFNAALYETKIMARHDHPHLQRLLGICMSDGIQIISEMRLGSLKDFLKSNAKNLTLKELITYCHQISIAMEFLHSKDIVHADLAARNVLVKNRDHVEVSDFGLSKILRGRHQISVNQKMPWKWISFESLSGIVEKNMIVLDKPNDVWEYGVTCWEVLTLCRQSPYYTILDPTDLYCYLKNGKRLELDEQLLQNFYSDVFTILLSCWTVPSTQRANFIYLKDSFEKILMHL